MSMSRNQLLLLVLLVSANIYPLFSQKRDNKKLSHAQKHTVAAKLIESGAYYKGIEHMKEIVNANPDNKKYIAKLADAYYHSRDYKNAEIWYEKLKEAEAAKSKKGEITLSSYRYAECLKYNGKYENAREAFQLFASSKYNDKRGENYKQHAKNEIKSCEFAMQRKVSDVDVKFTHMGSNINSGYSDFAPALKDDSTLIYASLQSDSIIEVTHGETHFNHVKLYQSTYNDGAWGMPEELTGLNIVFGHAANGTFSADKKKFYFTRCINKPNAYVRCNIYVSDIDSVTGAFSKSKKIKSGINHKKHTTTQPVYAKITKGKKTEEALYYASDMRGGFGGMDIWYSTIDKDGNISSPINCGKTVNSPKDEISPYYDNYAGALYFSSNYHPGYGGYDVFKAKGWGSKYNKPENLKIPVNTSLDDTYYTLFPNNKLKGFIVSNRPGGQALISETCCDDIWSYEYKIPSILVINAIDSLSNQPIANAEIVVEGAKYEAGNDTLYNAEASLDYDTLQINDDPHFLKVIKIAEKQSSYYILGGNKKVNILAKSEGYNFSKASILTDSTGKADSIKAEVGSVLSEISGRVIKLTIPMTKGDRKATSRLLPAPPVEKKDTVKIASTLQEQFKNAEKPDTVKPAPAIVEDTLSKIPPKKVVVEFDFTVNIAFEYKAIQLDKQNQSILDSLILILRKKPALKIGFTTHTDGIGSEKYNMELSGKRAAFLANYLIKSGISKKRITLAEGKGEAVPLKNETKSDGSDDPDARRLNRRTEVRLYEE
ncbi:MAG: OmpA family protein [Cytophagales bacterium]|nr:OmpA family protein [Cytophagales bacterium]